MNILLVDFSASHPFAAMALLMVSPASAKSTGNPGILPPQSHPHGHTYGEWAARWWQWALETPASVNPFIDMTGEHCDGGQLGHVWFLAGVLGGGSATRTCNVPRGTALFFPVVNIAWFAFTTDPPEERTETFVRNAAAATCGTAVALEADIDGVKVNDPFQYFEQSPLFDVQLPPDNLFGATTTDIPELLLSPSVDEGYYLFLAPLSPGKHTLHWSGSWEKPENCPNLDVTYNLTVR